MLAGLAPVVAHHLRVVKRLAARVDALVLVDVALLGLGELVGAVAGDRGAVLHGEGLAAHEVAPDERPDPVPTPARLVREPPLDEEERARSVLGPVTEPLHPLLHGRPVEVDVHRVPAAHGAALVMVDLAGGVEPTHVGLGRGGRLPLVVEAARRRGRRVADAELHGVLVTAVAEGVVAHGVGEDAGVVLCLADAVVGDLVPLGRRATLRVPARERAQRVGQGERKQEARLVGGIEQAVE